MRIFSAFSASACLFLSACTQSPAPQASPASPIPTLAQLEALVKSQKASANKTTQDSVGYA